MKLGVKRARLALALVTPLFLTLVSHAQYQPGDLVFASAYFGIGNGPYIARVTSAGAVHTIRSPNYLHVTHMMCSPDNRSIWFSAFGKSQWGIYDIAPDGTLTTLTRRPMNLVGVNGEGEAICEEAHVGLFRLTGSGSLFTILSSTTYGGVGWGVDLAANEVIVDQCNAITRLNLHGPPAVTTIKGTRWTRFDRPICYDPVTDLFLGTGYRTLTAMRVRRGFAFASVAETPWGYLYQGMTIDPVARKAVLRLGGGWTPMGLYPRLDLFDLAKLSSIGVVLSGSSEFGLQPVAAVRPHSRHFAGISAARPGGVFSALVSVPLEPGAAYVAAFSFGMGPPIHSPDGRPICLRADSLFWLSLSNTGIFRDCQGVLDKRGEAVARVTIPRDQQLSGLRFFGVAVTVAGGQIRSISAPIGVTIQ